MYTKLDPETVDYIKFHINIFCNQFYLFIICKIYLESFTKVFHKTQTSH